MIEKLEKYVKARMEALESMYSSEYRRGLLDAYESVLGFLKEKKKKDNR